MLEKYILDEHEKLDYEDHGIKYQRTQPDKMSFWNNEMKGTVTYDIATDIFTIDINCKSHDISYYATNPIIRNSSYSGSALPYPNHYIAYENSPNTGRDKSSNGHYIINVRHPSEYYVAQGRRLLKPHIHIYMNDLRRTLMIVLGDIIPDRSLKNLPNHPNRSTGR